MQPPQSKIVCVLGMHRTGTSITARLANLLGVYLGQDKHLLGAVSYNAKGLWENRFFVEINNEILKRLGGNITEIPSFDTGWEHSQTIANLEKKVRTYLQKEFFGHPLWGWKDPRTCLTLPFWKKIVSPTHYVMALRDPADVCRSFEKQQSALTPEWSLYLWLVHLQASIKATKGEKRIFVYYENFMEDWEKEIQCMAEFLQVTDKIKDPQVLQKVKAFLDPGLCHYRSASSLKNPGEQNISQRQELQNVRRIYLKLKLHSGNGDFGTPIESELQSSIDRLKPVVELQIIEKKYWELRWKKQAAEIKEELSQFISSHQKFILVDESLLTDDIGLQDAIPFPEKDGLYIGPPSDSEAAIKNLVDLKENKCADFLVITWPAFWWLDYYEKWNHYIRTNFQRVLENERIFVFDLNLPANDPRKELQPELL